MKQPNLTMTIMCASLLLFLAACSKSNSDKKTEEVTVKNAKICNDELSYKSAELVWALHAAEDAYESRKGEEFMSALQSVSSKCDEMLNHSRSDFNCKVNIDNETYLVLYKEVVETCNKKKSELNQILTANESHSSPTTTAHLGTSVAEGTDQLIRRCGKELEIRLEDFFRIYRKYESAKRSHDTSEKFYRDYAGRKCNKILADHSQQEFDCSMRIANSKAQINHNEFRQQCDALFAK